MIPYRPRFRTRKGYCAEERDGWWAAGRPESFEAERRVVPVRVVDAREPTAAQAVRKALQCFYDIHHSDRPDTVEKEMRAMAHDAGMNARVVNGRVRVDQLRNQGE